MSAARKETVAPAPRLPDDPWMSLLQASRLLKRQRLTLMGMVLDGTLVAARRDGMTFVSRESVERYLAAQAEAVA